MTWKPMTICAVASLIGLPTLAQPLPSPSSQGAPRPQFLAIPPHIAAPPLESPKSDLPRDPSPTMTPPRMDAPFLAPPAKTVPPPHPTDGLSAPEAPAAGPGDIAAGALVVDPSGVELGRVVEVTTPRPRQNPEAFVTLEEEGVTVALPVSSIMLADGTLTARESRSEVWGPQ